MKAGDYWRENDFTNQLGANQRSGEFAVLSHRFCFVVFFPKLLQLCPTLCDPTDDIHTTQHLSQQFICKEIHIKVHVSLSGAHFHLFLAWPILINSSKFILCFTFYEKYFLFNSE